MNEISSSFLDVKEVTKTFVTGPVNLEILKGVSFELKKGEMMGIIGASGAGKSTLLHIIGTLEHPTKGNICLEGQDVFALKNSKLTELRNRKIGFVFQFHHLLTEFNALENVMMPALIQRMKKEEAKEKAEQALIEVGLKERMTHKPAELSGGEQQRVAVARALINKPLLVLADEPTGNLDSYTSETIHDLFKYLNTEKKQSFLIVTHNANLAKKMDRIINLTDGKISES